ncbi:E3 ubiquitin-protein ligase [Quillaja saponaria]|uniref:E3 ubiquitin-protein ligase n=1 Tax=Quillaja saponaria TaxID=32244 RepID=A0AAD7PDQ8_QUISA|nr:E3 ubiquitin-protein ligase [Quillaja saponaria]
MWALTLGEHESVTSNDGTASSLPAALLVALDMETSIPNTYQPPPAPFPYDVVLGCPPSTNSKSGRETVSGNSFETLVICEDIEESNYKARANSSPSSPRKFELSKTNEPYMRQKKRMSVPFVLKSTLKRIQKL